MWKGHLLETMPLCSMNKLSNYNNNNNSWFKYDLVIRFSSQTGQELLKKNQQQLLLFIALNRSRPSHLATTATFFSCFQKLPVIVPFLLQFSFIPFLWGVGRRRGGGGGGGGGEGGGGGGGGG